MIEPRDTHSVRIEPWAEGDLPLLEQLTGDPAMMAHLGGPESREKIAERHARYLATSAGDQMFRIVDVESGEAVGSVGYWERAWRGQHVYEIGWSVIRRSRAVASRARRQRRRSRWPGRRAGTGSCTPSRRSTTRVRTPSAGSSGFELLGECEVEYPPGSFMRCNDWRLDLFAGG